MKTLTEVYSALRRKNSKQYLLLAGCIFFSVLLITAYATMMRAPTVLNVLPEGGDSRKQIIAVFGMAAIGCAIFTVYAANLFFRYKSREIGLFMALGAGKKQIRNQLFGELFLISICSCVAGAILGTPLAYGVWQIFRLCIVNTEEMRFSFSPQSYIVALLFSVFTMLCFFINAARFLKRTNVMDILSEQRRSEPIHNVKPWCGIVGIILIFAGFFAGYFVPYFCVTVLQVYPSPLLNLLYLPIAIGMYMILLHTVVRGWRTGRKRDKNIIVRSTMLFQGRQTVNSMMVITLLIAAAYFASFYIPMLGIGGVRSIDRRPYDYMFHYRNDQDIITNDELYRLADGHEVRITELKQAEFANVAVDGQKHIEEGKSFHNEYRPLLGELNMMAQSTFNAITGQAFIVNDGEIYGVDTDQGTAKFMISDTMEHIINPVTDARIPVAFAGYAQYDLLAKYYIISDADYAEITQGSTPEWTETLIAFDVTQDSYTFGKALYRQIVQRSGDECATANFYDRIEKRVAEAEGKAYWADDEPDAQMLYSQQESSSFKMYWRYMPQFRLVDSSDLLANYAVFFMVFLFVAIVCFAAVIIIAYTRGTTIALNSQQMYEDLKRLGASPQYLYRCARGQISQIYTSPIVVGTLAVFFLYTLIMMGNDGKLAPDEMAGLAVCALVTGLGSLILWAAYRANLRGACRTLRITAKKIIK